MTIAAAPLELSTKVERARRTLSLAQKFAIAFLGLVAAVLCINGAIDMAITYRDARVQAVRVQQEKANAAAERVVQFVTEIEQQLGWTTRAEWARVSVEQRRYDFIRLLRQAAAITELVHVDGAGKEQLKLSRLEPDQVGTNADYSADPRFVATVRDKIYYGPVTFRRGSEPYMTIGMAHAGRNAGATIAEVNLKLAWDVITAIRVGDTGYAFITDPAGRLIAHPDMSLVLRNTDLTSLPQVAAARKADATTAPVDAGIGPDGNSVLSANAKVPKVGWNVFVELPSAEALGRVWSALYQTLALLALGVGLAGAAGTLLARRMVVPITELQAGAQKLGEGDLASRIPVRSGDEIGALAQRFNVMAGRIQESQETLERRVEDRTADLNEALEQQTATAEVLKVISRSAFDLPTVLRTLIASATRLCGAEQGLISFLRNGVLLPEASYGTPPGYLEFMRANPMRPGNESFSGRAALTGEVVNIADALADKDFTFTESQKRSGYRAMLAVPLKRDGEVIGVFAMPRAAIGAYSKREVELVQTFADQAVIAIENARLLDEVQARTKEVTEALEYQTATSDVLGVISRSPNELMPVFDAVVAGAAKLCGATFANILQYDGEQLHMMGAYNFNSAILKKFEQLYPRRPDRATLAGRAILDGKIVHIPDILIDPTYPPDRAREGGWRAMLAVPMMRNGLPIGVIALGKAEPGHYSPRQVAVVETFADQAVIAIQNARLFEEVQARTKEVTEALEYQTASSEVLAVISRSPNDLQPVLDTLVASAQRLCEAEDAIIYVREGDVVIQRAHVGRYPWHLNHRQPLNRRWVTGRAVLDGSTVHVPDFEATEEFPEGKAMAIRTGTDNRAALACPLMRDGVAIGAILMRRLEPRPFTDRQIKLLETFADQAVIAMNNARLFEQVQERTRELQGSLEDLRTAQDRLVQTEKLASLGQLTAGVAHEIKNPLNFVNNFAELSVELVGEIEEAIASANPTLDAKSRAEVDEIAGMLKGNLAKVVHHGRRADSIVKNMLAHSRESGGERRAVDLNAAVEEALNLAYHGARAEKPGFNITLERDYDPAIGPTAVFPQEFTRVLLNLIGNGFHAANKKRLDGAAPGFEPVLHVATKAYPDRIEIKVRDNGTGIPDAVKARIFEPFFTTKPTGEGTGLGLSLSHDIVVKQHGGSLSVDTEPGSFTEFTVVLPRKVALLESKK